MGQGPIWFTPFQKGRGSHAGSESLPRTNCRSADRQRQQCVGDSVGGMAQNVAFVGEVAGDALDAERFDPVEVGDGGFGAFGGVALAEFARDGGSIDERVVEDGAAGVLVDTLDMLGGGEVQAFVGLGHEIADEDAGGLGGAEGFRDAVDEEIGDDAGVERAGADGDEVGGGDGGEGFGRRGRMGRVEGELDDALAAGGDPGLAADDGAVFHAGDDGDIGRCCGKDVSAGREDFGGEADRLGEVAGHLGKGSDEQVAEVVAFEVASVAKAVAEKAGDQALVFGEGNHAIAQVAGGEHVEVAAEAAAGAAVVGDGDDRGEVGDEGGRRWVGAQARGVRDAELEAAQEG